MLARSGLPITAAVCIRGSAQGGIQPSKVGVRMLQHHPGTHLWVQEGPGQPLTGEASVGGDPPCKVPLQAGQTPVQPALRLEGAPLLPPPSSSSSQEPCPPRGDAAGMPPPDRCSGSLPPCRPVPTEHPAAPNPRQPSHMGPVTGSSRTHRRTHGQTHRHSPTSPSTPALRRARCVSGKRGGGRGACKREDAWGGGRMQRERGKGAGGGRAKRSPPGEAGREAGQGTGRGRG